MSYGVGGIIAAVCLIIGYIFGQKTFIRKIKPLGTLLILVDEIDGSRYPLVELNNDHDLWELKTGEVATFVVKRKNDK